MLDPKMEKALNAQINAEHYSAFLYLAMAAQFAELGLPGGQQWMTAQYKEELVHAQVLFDYVIERGGRVELEAIAKPPTTWPSGTKMFEDAYAHEQKVTGLIHDLASLALELKDHATYQFLQWFISEQVEEEATASDFLQKFKMAEQSAAGLYQLDKELGTRVFVSPTVYAW
ncbi:MAG TPA: ferritin [Thermoleophilia bacterium]|nr:ferritin [Thermoleophilia bacterium]HQG04293.1 ferritin [Thermoleophilia bacterium]HQG54216.1 ferritin [Thermoleophilia bacterium]HQJ97800.1 ferritin [Thermoleophilia bacterium]